MSEGFKDFRVCPACQGETDVAETRGSRRRRVCKSCGERFTTVEISADELRDLEDMQKNLRTVLRHLEEAQQVARSTPGLLDDALKLVPHRYRKKRRP